MTTSHCRQVRKHRRGLKAVMKHGKKAKRRHKRLSGRTGSIFTKRLASRNIDLNMGRLGLSPP